jgi:CDP-diacylglycerol--glycerol-3-phosphate 3-phosphatidyltransferase
MERPERIVLIILGALFNWAGAMAPVLWILAVLSTMTVIHRVVYTYQKTKNFAPVSDVKDFAPVAQFAQSAPRPVPAQPVPAQPLPEPVSSSAVHHHN